MKNFKNNYFRKISGLAFLVIIFLFSIGATTNTVKKGKNNTIKKVQAGGEFFVFDINNLNIPVDNKGVIADVDPGTGVGAGAWYDNVVFLFSSGFYVSGYSNGALWGNGVLSASRIEDYQPGPVGSNKNDSKNVMYVVSQQDKQFGDSWQEWSDAVSIGADFYDGDGDGAYSPIDKNGNGKWDKDEDRPDILGDVTAWCVYNDGLVSALRRFSVNPQGIEIHQSVFGFKAKSIVGDLMFVRYRIKNSGAFVDTLKDIYFSAAADPDLGDSGDDLVGSDINLSAGFVYNDGDDISYGANPPAFLMDFFQGPYVYIPGETFTDVDGDGVYTDGVDVALDTAYAVRGPQIGVDQYIGAKNIPLTSMSQYIQSHPTHGDPDTHTELRNYMIGGHGKTGDSLYVSNWEFGNGPDLAAQGIDTSSVIAKYMYSGDPEKGTGWLNIKPFDQRQMSNTGPFNLAAGEYQDIYVAYVVGRGTDAKNSVTVAKETDKTAQIIFDNNFPAPPPPDPISYTIESGDGFIDITWDTYKQVPYDVQDTVLLLRNKFEGYYLTAFGTPTSQITINGVLNAKEVISYDLDNIIEDIYSVDKQGNTNLVRRVSANPLDSLLYADPATGRIRYRVTKNPLTGADLIPGHEYYFAIGMYTLNHNAIVNKETGVYGGKGDYVDPTNSAFNAYETPLFTFTYGVDESNPALIGGDGSNSGASDGAVKYVVVNKEELTGDDYSVTFYQNLDSAIYRVFWKLTNTTTNTVLVDSSTNFDFNSDNVASVPTEGFITKVQEAIATISNLTTQQNAFVTSTKWFDVFNRAEKTGAYYVGTDIPYAAADDLESPIGNPAFPAAKSNIITAGDLRQIEVRFGEPSMAYRYLNGFVGGAIGAINNYFYGDAVTPADTVSKGQVGKWDTVNDHAMGLVEVPFSVYVKDEKFGEDKKLAVGFIETSHDSKIAARRNNYGKPDGIWDPLDRVDKSKEVIIIFNEDYNENGGNIIYTGGFDDGKGGKVWADIINGYKVPAGSLSSEDSLIAASPFFNAMYVLNIHRIQNPDSTSEVLPFWSDGDKLTVGIDKYPYTKNDNYTFTTRAGGALTNDELKNNFDKVNVFPNPLFAYNPQTSYDGQAKTDDPFVTFSHLPEDATVAIYSLSGSLLRTLDSFDKASPSSQFLRWDLKNESGLRVASGLYIALVESVKYGQKILKFSVILPQKQLPRY
ncbi:MAG: hypothetical protein KKF62_07710 [Bacteroidetes bacterium]|nr:hypothetical protein [Bacteroidota bacterium]MBU1115968.1 hypothetical protein [Bacteroidota bacterium]MBU1798435.1 hypothetical protein [Bacteroidota bacterium]